MRTKSFFMILSTILTFSFCLKSQMTFETIQQGKNLEKVPLISPEEFFQLWIKNQRKLKFQTNVTSLFKNSEYVYFGKNDLLGYSWKTRFFKVSSDLLKKEFPNYESFFAEDLERYYWNHRVSKEDRDLWIDTKNQDRKKCGPEFFYSLSNQRVVLEIRWEVNPSCPKLTIFHGKNDRIRYDCRTEKISIGKE
ncbi:hypothetical protein [Leptospira weilii]